MRTEAPYEELRPLLFSIAYRMVSSVSEAEDIVQEAFFRIHRAEAEGTKVDSPKAYLAAVVTRLSIDHLKSARARREQYVGQWLPEPLLTDSAPDAAAQAETADSLSMAFLVLLESLTPVERAVFLLREVFEYDYGEIATVVGRSEDNCRQLYVRARRHIDQGRPRFEASREQRDELARRFFAAAQLGDTNALIELLAADVVVYGDDGGKAPSWTEPIYGREPRREADGRHARAGRAARRVGGDDRTQRAARRHVRGRGRPHRCGHVAQDRRRRRPDNPGGPQPGQARPPRHGRRSPRGPATQPDNRVE